MRLIAIAVSALLLAARMLFAGQDLQPQGVAMLQGYVAQEYRSYQMARTGLDHQTLADLMDQAGKVRFRKLSARYDGSDVIIRAEMEPNPAAPPDVPALRYFRMEHSLIQGWIYPSRSNALSYYTALMPMPV